MRKVIVYKEMGVDIDLSSLANNLNSMCKYLAFTVGSTQFSIEDTVIQIPGTYKQLGPAIKKETEGCYAVFFSQTNNTIITTSLKD